MQSGLELEREVDTSTWNQTIHPSQYTRSHDDDDEDDDVDDDGDGGGGGGSFNLEPTNPSKSIHSIWS